MLHQKENELRDGMSATLWMSLQFSALAALREVLRKIGESPIFVQAADFERLTKHAPCVSAAFSLEKRGKTSRRPRSFSRRKAVEPRNPRNTQKEKDFGTAWGPPYG